MLHVTALYRFRVNTMVVVSISLGNPPVANIGTESLSVVVK